MTTYPLTRVKVLTLHTDVRIVNFNLSVSCWFQQSFTIDYQNKSLVNARWHFILLKLRFFNQTLQSPIFSLIFNVYENSSTSCYHRTKNCIHSHHLPQFQYYVCIKWNNTCYTKKIMHIRILTCTKRTIHRPVKCFKLNMA